MPGTLKAFSFTHFAFPVSCRKFLSSSHLTGAEFERAGNFPKRATQPRGRGRIWIEGVGHGCGPPSLLFETDLLARHFLSWGSKEEREEKSFALGTKAASTHV